MNLLVETDRKALLERLRRIEPETPRVWGTMTAHQMICHVSDQLRVALGDVESRDRGTFLHKTLVRWIVVRLPIPAPKGKIQTVPEMLTSRPATWDDDVRALEELVERVVAAESFSPHPVFGRLSRQEWGILGAKHMDHHLRQFGV